jgi:hypothetical protein
MQCHIRIKDIVRRHMLNIMTSDTKSGDRLSLVGIEISQAFTLLHMHLHSVGTHFVSSNSLADRGLTNLTVGSTRCVEDSVNFIGLSQSSSRAWSDASWHKVCLCQVVAVQDVRGDHRYKHGMASRRGSCRPTPMYPPK